jgi:hypothetical protein
MLFYRADDRRGRPKAITRAEPTQAWCQRRGTSALPASATVMAAYLVDLGGAMLWDR